ncbi:Zinc-type alcohol dehydrogenase-like protein [Pseudocercospora fuligena]|uniref:Zinc-type alcohol dehydrogenase-like protein n=1 Tax=Pseudocercospora fuligena TaxID=685502 RepID=A0A8H6VJX0_9PEZI|nr:Zinc-type alcohol dehydrogenase-like protein [Pseudocercospora fuligena]
MSMKAIHLTKPGKPADVLALETISKPKPEPTDLLVKIKACSVNPIDTKIRQGGFPAPDITGFDASGIVESVGSSVKGYKEGDEVYYAGLLGRPGTTAQYHLVDYRSVAIKPKKLDWVASACIPLVTLTAWELLEEHFNLVQDDPSGKQKEKSIIIINGAGGVGSIATQLARKVFKLGKVIVTASRPETIGHAKKMGATDVISHRKPLKAQLKEKFGVDGVDYIFICYDTNAYLPVAVDIANPLARIGSIVEVSDKLESLHTMDAFMKALSFHWELMFSKGVHKVNMESQGDILKRAAELFDAGGLISLETERDVLSVQSLVKVHEKLESGKAIGKTGLEVGEDIQ